MKNKTVAIYSGEIPSTTFIERLVLGLSSADVTIYLFGKQKKKIKYPKNVKLFSYSNKISKFVVLLKYTVLLTLYKPKEKHKLDKIIASEKGNNQLKKIKYYPVLYHKPEIFHLQWAKGIEDWLWVKEFGIKYVLSLRGTHISISPIVDQTLKKKYETNFHKIDGFHAVSKTILKEARNYEQNLKNATVIYSGLELEKLIFRPKISINSELKVLSIGRSHWLKGYNYALDALAILKQENFNFQYTILGIETGEELIFQRNQLDLDESISFQKNISFNQVIEQIYKADIVLLPSLEEGIANVVIEAMALGTIVISTDCGGMKEIIKNEENGFLVPTRDSKAIAKAIKKIKSLSLESYNKITLEAKFAIEKQHSVEKMVADFNEFYDLISSKNTAS